MCYDVAIIGAGVVGGLIARELTKFGAKVCLLEKENDVGMGATRANSAIVHAGFDAKVGSLKAKLNVRGSQMMEQITAELGVKYRRNGSLVVGFNGEDRKTLEDLKARGEANGVPGLYIAERDELKALEPNVGDGVLCALVAPSGAIVCPYELCIAAVGNAMDNGADLKRNFKVVSVERKEGSFRITAGNGDSVEASFAVNCAGVFSDEVAAMIGDTSFRVHPRRGEYMLLDRECGNLVSHTVFRCPSKMGKGILVSPTVDGNLLLGPTAEDMTDKDDTKTTAEGLAAVRAQASEQVSGINFGKIITSFTGLRSVGDTGDFIINMPVPGFVNAAGIESPGLSSSPAIAVFVREMLGNAGLPLRERDDFDPIRPAAHAFREMSDEDKNEIIRKNPAYAHVICRCETVSEGEILDAIRRNPKPTDLDGVKRRTRATMGRCQGGFCSPYIVELLARELDIPFDKVTKSGGASFINVGKTKTGR